MSKKKTSSTSTPKPKGEPIFTWAFESSRPRAGGQVIHYEVRLNEDKSITCNCPGWVFKKKSDTRGCKHTNHTDVTKQCAEVYALWKKGEVLPMIAIGSTGALTLAAGAMPTQKFGRRILLD